MSQPIRRGATGISEQVLHSKEGIEQEELALRRLRHAYREELDRVKVRFRMQTSVLRTRLLQ